MFKKLFEASASMNEYFLVASFTWALLEEAAALHAATAAAVIMVPEQRENMLAILAEFASSPHLEEVLTAERQARLAALQEFIKARDWSYRDIRKAKQLLKLSSPAYHKAICNWYGAANADVFMKAHPELGEMRLGFAEWLKRVDRINRFF